MNIMTLYFIRDENKQKLKAKKMPVKKMSKTKRRKMKRLRKIKNKMDVDGEVGVNKNVKNVIDSSNKVEAQRK